MSNIAAARIIILWDHELRDAAKALKAFRDAYKKRKAAKGKEPKTELDRLEYECSQAGAAALQACWAAMSHLADEPAGNVTVMASRHIRNEVKE